MACNVGEYGCGCAAWSELGLGRQPGVVGFTDGGWDHFDRKNSKVIKNHYSLIFVGLGRRDWVWEVLLRGVVSF